MKDAAAIRAAALEWIERSYPRLIELSTALGNGWTIERSTETALPELIRLELSDGTHACPLSATLPCPDSAIGSNPLTFAERHGLPDAVVDELIRAADGEPGPVRDRMLVRLIPGIPFDPATGPRYPVEAPR